MIGLSLRVEKLVKGQKYLIIGDSQMKLHLQAHLKDKQYLLLKVEMSKVILSFKNNKMI